MQNNPHPPPSDQKLPTVSELARLAAVLASHSLPEPFDLLSLKQWKPPAFEARDLWLRCVELLQKTPQEQRLGLKIEQFAFLTAVLLQGKDLQTENLNRSEEAGLKLWQRCQESAKRFAEMLNA